MKNFPTEDGEINGPSGQQGAYALPPLAKLKQASLARRRFIPPISEFSIPTYISSIEEIIEQSMSGEISHKVDSPHTVSPTDTQLLSQPDALATILQLDPNHPCTRLHQLHAARSLILSQQDTHTRQLMQLSRRVRHTAIQLAFHRANINRIKQHTMKTRTNENYPWIPTRAADSKHKAATAKPQTSLTLFPHRQIAPLSPEASALQVKLLNEVYEKMVRKLVLALLRSNAALNRLKRSLVERISIANTQSSLLSRSFTVWKEESLVIASSNFDSALLDSVNRFMSNSNQKERRTFFIAWRHAAQEARQHQQALVYAQALYEKRLLLDAITHWRLASHMRHLKDVRNTLLDGWLELQGKHRGLAAWRRITARRRWQRHALGLAGRASRHFSVLDQAVPEMTVMTVPPRLPYSSLRDIRQQARTFARTELAGLKAYICQIASEISVMKLHLRWTKFSHGDVGNGDALSTTGVVPRMMGMQYNPEAYSSPVKRKCPSDNQAGRFAKRLAVELFECNEEIRNLEEECSGTRREMEETVQVMASIVAAHEQTQHDLHTAQVELQKAEIETEEALKEEIQAREHLEFAQNSNSIAHEALVEAMDAVAASRAATHAATQALISAREEYESSLKSVEIWKKKVAAAASEIPKASKVSGASSAIVVKVKEARQRLELEQKAAENALKELPSLMESAQDAEKAMQGHEVVFAEAQKTADTASNTLADANARYSAARQTLESAEILLKNAKSRMSTLQSQLVALVDRLVELEDIKQSQAALLFTKEKEMSVLEHRVAEIDEMHSKAVHLSISMAFDDEQVKTEAEEEEEEEARTTQVLPQTSKESKSMSLQPPAVHHNDENDNNNNNNNRHHDHHHVMLLEHAQSTSLPNGNEEEENEEEDDDDENIQAARAYYIRLLIRRAQGALVQHAQEWRALHQLASQRYLITIATPILVTWRDAAAEETYRDEQASAMHRLKTCLRSWITHTAHSRLLSSRQHQLKTQRNMARLARCFEALVDYASEQRHYQSIICLTSQRKTSAVLAYWHQWTIHCRRQKVALQVVINRRHRTIARQCFETWKNNAAKNALLRRVFTNAIDLWGAQVGGAMYEAEFALMQRCFIGWQVGSHTQLEERRNEVLSIAADRFRVNRVLKKTLQALRVHAAEVVDLRKHRPLAHAGFLAWRAFTRHNGDNAIAKRQYHALLSKKTLNAWSGSATATACKISVFYVKWQTIEPARHALKCWRVVLEEKRKWEERRRAAGRVRTKHASEGIDGSGCDIPPHCHDGVGEQQEQRIQRIMSYDKNPIARTTTAAILPAYVPVMASCSPWLVKASHRVTVKPSIMSHIDCAIPVSLD